MKREKAKKRRGEKEKSYSEIHYYENRI